jgi:hypothetical protein
MIKYRRPHTSQNAIRGTKRRSGREWTGVVPANAGGDSPFPLIALQFLQLARGQVLMA